MNLHKLMTILIPLLMLGIVSCANNVPRETPDWAVAELPTLDITPPVDLPSLCKILVIEGADGNRYGTWSADCWKSLQAYEITAEANTDIAQANAQALMNMEVAYGAVVNAGKMQKELSDFYTQLLVDEKKQRFYDGVIFKSIIGLGLLIAIP